MREFLQQYQIYIWSALFVISLFYLFGFYVDASKGERISGWDVGYVCLVLFCFFVLWLPYALSGH